MKRFLLLLMCIALPHSSLFADMGAQHGEVDFRTSCTEQAQVSFESGLLLLHHMMYEKAEEQFQASARADSECAMAYWGIAMANIHPLWGQPPSEQAFNKAHNAAQKAKVAKHQGPREADYADAVATIFAMDNIDSYAQQRKAFEQAYEALHDKYPNDIDAAALHALGMLATVDKGDPTLAQQKRAGEMLDTLREQSPNHPGLFHYAIHAYDHPRLAEKAIEVARSYDKLAPEVPHALHMPSHIFVRQGHWQAVIDWNKRSAEAALKSPAGETTSLHYMHALDYLAYAYLQQGQIDKARDVVADIMAVERYQPSFPSAYAVAAVPARVALEQGNWEQAAQLELPAAKGLSWEQFPHAAANITYAKGIGAARSGDIEAAKKAEQQLEATQQKLQEMGEGYWAELVEAQKNAVAGWIALQQGNESKAIELIEIAAEQEEALDKHPVTPGSVIPARELLGDLMLELDEPDLALEAYQMNLDLSPNRTRSLLGAATSTQELGETDAARGYFARLNDNFENADPDYVLKQQASELTAAGPDDAK